MARSRPVDLEAMEEVAWFRSQDRVSPGSLGGPVVIIGGGTFPQDYALLYEDANFEGDWLDLEANHSYPRLEAVGRGFLQLGDWNDVISSVKLLQVGTCVLFENEYFGELDGGSSLDSQRLGKLSRSSWMERSRLICRRILEQVKKVVAGLV